MAEGPSPLPQVGYLVGQLGGLLPIAGLQDPARPDLCDPVPHPLVAL